MDVEYKPGDTVPETSALYRVIHHPLQNRVHLETFYCGDCFPPCPECGESVRYVLPRTVLRK